MKSIGEAVTVFRFPASMEAWRIEEIRRITEQNTTTLRPHEDAEAALLHHTRTAMKNLIRYCLVSGLLAGSALITRAEEPATAPAPAAPAVAPAAKKAHTAATAEHKKLTPEERKAHADARLKELHAKKASGKLTEKETQQLARLEKRSSETAGKATSRSHKAAAAKTDTQTDSKSDTK